MTVRHDIDFPNSHAVLVGTARYEVGFGQVSMPAAANSLREMARILTDVGGWPSSRVTSFQDMGTKDAPLERVAATFHDVKDVLIFYYVGHGQLLVGNDLGLALTDTSEERRKRLSTSLRLSDLRLEMDHNCDARIKILILDCCCSGVATRYAQGADAGAAMQAAAELEGEGTYTWTACGHTQDAYFEPGIAGKTYFTKFISEVVRGGIVGGRPGLTISEVNREVRKRLRSVELEGVLVRPEPSLLFKGTSDSFILAPNVASPKLAKPNASPSSLAPEPQAESAEARRSRHREELSWLRRRIEELYQTHFTKPVPELVTASDIRAVRFTTVRLREGYDEDEVDALLDSIEEALRAWESGKLPTNQVTLQQVHYTQFTTVRLREGYDEEEVDALLDRVEEALIYYEGPAGRIQSSATEGE
ncbi:caspase, EACC1-associated type [Catenulispora pinisilvae]|uniref:caspase, EACC1-associated type n=1 Tax=Catenulispora pinisilvae TaxID=2705253 RepID=UPI003F69C2A3